MICLFQVDNPLEQAIKFLKPLQILATDRIETHICAYEIYSRKGECRILNLEFYRYMAEFNTKKNKNKKKNTKYRL